MHADDVRMAELCRRPGLAEESLDFRQVEPAFVRNLHRHQAIQLKVPGLPHRPKPARPQQLDQLEMADALVRRRRLAIASRPVLRLVGDQAELAPAGRACRFGKLFLRRQRAPAIGRSYNGYRGPPEEPERWPRCRSEHVRRRRSTPATRHRRTPSRIGTDHHSPTPQS